MTDTAIPAKYSATARLFHWAIVILFFVMLPLGIYMHELPMGAERDNLFFLHRSAGILLLGLMVARLVWRHISPPPPFPGTMSRFERLAAKTVHMLFYVLLIAVPLNGWVMTGALGEVTPFFGLFELPALSAPDKALVEMLKTGHMVLAILTFLLVALHAGAALRHHFILKDDVLRRMLPGR